MRTFLFSFSLIALSCGAFSCSRAMSDIDQFSDCKNVCSRYKDCFSSTYDTDACENRCRSMDHHNGTSAVDHCSTCIEGRSCTKATFACATECGGIVP